MSRSAVSEAGDEHARDPAAWERRQAALSRRALDRQVASVLESLTHAFITLDRAWRITYANREAAHLNGTTPDALLGRDHWETWPETRGSEVERVYRDVVARREPAHFVHHYASSGVWHEIHAYPADDDSLAVLFRDITEERRAAAERDRLAAALAERDRQLATLVENASDVIVRVDAHGRFTFANPALERVTGLPVAQLVGRTAAETPLPRALVTRWEALLTHVLTCGEEYTLDFAYRALGTTRHMEARGVPERDAAGRVVSILVIGRDVSERTRAQRAVSAALAAAQAANRAKSTFLATMSHELRTPLNAIRGYAELLAMGVHGPVTDDQREALERIRRSERHLLGVIGDILDFARLETGRMSYAIEPVALRPVVDEVAGLVQVQASAKGLTFDYRACDALVRADGRRLRQVILNLLANAVKFTPAGGTVTLRCTPAPDVVTVRVRDTGPGIPGDERERIFEPFVQLGRSRSNPVGGTGLGLAISRELARAMGGDLWVEPPAPGEDDGSTFVLRLRAAGTAEG